MSLVPITSKAPAVVRPASRAVARIPARSTAVIRYRPPVTAVAVRPATAPPVVSETARHEVSRAVVLRRLAQETRQRQAESNVRLQHRLQREQHRQLIEATKREALPANITSNTDPVQKAIRDTFDDIIRVAKLVGHKEGRDALSAAFKDVAEQAPDIIRSLERADHAEIVSRVSSGQYVQTIEMLVKKANIEQKAQEDIMGVVKSALASWKILKTPLDGAIKESVKRTVTVFRKLLEQSSAFKAAEDKAREYGAERAFKVANDGLWKALIASLGGFALAKLKEWLEQRNAERDAELREEDLPDDEREALETEQAEHEELGECVEEVEKADREARESARDQATEAKTRLEEVDQELEVKRQQTDNEQAQQQIDTQRAHITERLRRHQSIIDNYATINMAVLEAYVQWASQQDEARSDWSVTAVIGGLLLAGAGLVALLLWGRGGSN